MLTKFTAFAMGVLLSVSAMAADMATLTRQAQSGDAAAQSDLAYEYDQQGNHAEAFEWFTKAAYQGHAVAQYNLGVMYAKGQGVRQDYHKAVEWYTKAANQGNARAQFLLGFMYEKGLGVSQNTSTAKRYFGQACDNGNQLACLNYSLLNKEVEWTIKAANQGDAAAQYNLGQMYRKGQGVRQDYQKAVEWYTKAAQQGDADAQYKLGLMYALGLGVLSQDKSTAKGYFGQACGQGVKLACDSYQELSQ